MVEKEGSDLHSLEGRVDNTGLLEGRGDTVLNRGESTGPSVIYSTPHAPTLLDSRYRHPSLSPEGRIDLWATEDETIRRLGGLNGWKHTPLNEYDRTHARSEDEIIALKATEAILKLGGDEFYKTHRCYKEKDAYRLITYLECESKWMDEAVNMAFANVARKRAEKTGKFEVHRDEMRRVRTAVCSKESLHRRFRTFYYVFHNVLGNELEYRKG